MPVRSTALVGCFAAVLSALAPSAASAQEAYPARPIRIIVPTSPGSGNDTVARLLAQRLIGTEIVRDIIAKLHTAIVAILGTTEVRSRLAGDGSDVIANSPEEFGGFIKAETFRLFQKEISVGRVK